MKIYNKKYLFIGILASIITACGSGGGGGGSSSNSPSASTPSPTVSSKPNTNIVAPVKPEVNKPKDSDDNGYDPNLPAIEEKEEVAPAPQPEELQPEGAQPGEP